MPESLPFLALSGATWLLRPLLSTPRVELETYMQENQLAWVEDDSNQDDRYDRNFLRLHIMPALTERYRTFRMLLLAAQLYVLNKKRYLMNY